MTDMDQQFHESFKPRWGPHSILLYALSGKSSGVQQKSSNSETLMKNGYTTIVSEGRDIRISEFMVSPNVCSIPMLQAITKY